MLLAMDDHKTSLAVFFYLSAAFDTIDDVILVNRMRNDYGLCGKALDWLESYLTDRYQSYILKTIPLSIQKIILVSLQVQSCDLL